jgi:GNAT superfamily N-acetyltransferase
MELVTDLALARRIETTEARANAAFVEARARRDPAIHAEWRDLDGTWAMFDGVGSPLTQSFRLGLFSDVTDAHLAALEAFFAEHGAEVFHEVSPLAGNEVLPVLAGRGYRPVELTTLLFQPLVIAALQPAVPSLRVRRIAADETDRWVATSAAGWGETPELAEFMRGFGAILSGAEGVASYLAEWDGEPIAAAAMAIHDGMALLAGAATIPAFRGRGAQGALLQHRLQDAAILGCDIAMMGTAPGSTSQRNAEREGFRIAYTRMKWGRG